MTTYPAAPLRAIAERLGLPSVSEIARGVGVSAVYRITAAYARERALDSAATLVRTTSGAQLSIAFVGAFGGKALHHAISLERYDQFVRALNALSFDHMTDAADLPAFGSADLWLVERSAGAYTRAIIVAPEQTAATTPHGRLIAAVKEHLPEALREVPR